MSTRNGLVVAIAGATGAVGSEMLAVLRERNLPIERLVPLASERSAGQRVEWQGDELRVERLTPAAFEGVDIALFSAGAAVSRELAPAAVAAGATVIDNTSAFRMDPEVPLVVPEVNPDAAERHRGIIANPNCSTIQMVVALKPLHDRAGLRRVVVSTYQSASGAGRSGMDELRDQTVDLLNFREPKVERFARRLAFDVLPHIDTMLDDGTTKEEQKMVHESRKIMGLPDLRVSATCVRVPVFVGHSLAVNAELERPLDLDEARAALAAMPGLVLSEPGAYPTANDAAGRDEVFVGRLRRDPSVPSGFDLWVVADNLRKGAATNAVQVAELLVARDCVRRRA